MKNLEFTKNYIKEQIQQRGLDENNQIEIDFSDICTKDDAISSAFSLGYSLEQGEGQGVWWLVKEN